MEPFRTVTGAAAPLALDDVNTDQIIPSAYLKDLQADLAEGFLAYMRRAPDGTAHAGFVLEQPAYRNAPILVTGANFGCGSSREHAVWAMRAYGVRCVIGMSPAELFRENCLKNGVLAVVLDAAAMGKLFEEVERVGGLQPFTVDLEACEIRGPAGFTMPFQIDAAERSALLQGLDDIGMTLQSADAIQAWEARAAKLHPFMQSPIDQLATAGRDS